jgi:hypothetical protein
VYETVVFYNESAQDVCDVNCIDQNIYNITLLLQISSNA